MFTTTPLVKNFNAVNLGTEKSNISVGAEVDRQLCAKIGTVKVFKTTPKCSVKCLLI